MALDIDVELGAPEVIAVEVLSTAQDVTVVQGGARLWGWSLREAGGAAPVDVNGQVVAPAATTVIATTGALAAGVYDVTWTVSLDGAAAAADQNNFKLFNGAGAVMASVNAGAAGAYPQPTARLTVAANNAISVQSIGAGTAAVTYDVSIVVAPVTSLGFQAEIRDAGQSLGASSANVQQSDTRWFGSPGLTVNGKIVVHVIAGTVAGAIYISSD